MYFRKCNIFCHVVLYLLFRRSGSHQHREEGFPEAILPAAGLLMIAYAKVAAASSHR